MIYINGLHKHAGFCVEKGKMILFLAVFYSLYIFFWTQIFAYMCHECMNVWYIIYSGYLNNYINVAKCFHYEHRLQTDKLMFLLTLC